MNDVEPRDEACSGGSSVGNSARGVLLALSIGLVPWILSSCSAEPEARSTAEPLEFADSLADPLRASLRVNQVQVIGSHNSYKEAIAPRLLAAYARENAESAESLDYWHPPLSDQLDIGLRKLEIDILHDPHGGRYANPNGLALAPEEGVLGSALFDLSGSLAEPGFKSLHVQDLDFRSNCPTFVGCLLELRAWSETHSGHLPILVTMNTKDQVIDRKGFVRPLPFGVEALRALDEEVLRVLGRDRVLTPDDVRGRAPDLETAILGEGWPTLQEAGGKFMFVLDQGGAIRDAYLEGNETLEGRVLFVNVDPGHPSAAIRILNDPIALESEIRESVAAGYLVRTRADANTAEARSGDTSRREASFATGAQYVSTDYYLPEQLPGSDYLVRLPDAGEDTVARCLSQLTTTGCTLAAVPEGGHSPRLIAHRGGVVDGTTPENSRAAFEKSVREGYWMIEVDLRATRDGAVVVHHDADLERTYGDARLVAQVSRDELEKLRMVVGGEPPLFLDELAQLAGGRIELMLDFKPEPAGDGVLDSVSEVLAAHGLLNGAYVIGTAESRSYFREKAVVGASLDVLERMALDGQFEGAHFLFEHGRDLTPLDVLRARELGVIVVPSVNLFHYADLESVAAEAPRFAAEQDLSRLRRMGVREFQIDSVYAGLLLGSK